MRQYFYLTGPDGSGKTSLMEMLREELHKKGISTEHVWLRSPKILSKPLMAWCRLVGLTKYETIGGMKYGAHQFYRSAWVSWLFPWLQWADFNIKNNAIRRKIEKSKAQAVLYDRYALDTLADLMVDTGRWGLPSSSLGKKFRRLLPDGIHILVVRVEEETIRNRKMDTLYDPHLDRKIKAYEIIAKEFEIPILDNNGPMEEVRKEMLKAFIQDERL